jgi:peptidoglycan/LPS O-acetylase OafA/YrhL
MNNISLTSRDATALTEAAPAVAARRPAQRLPGIEGLRCIAALCVLLLHAQANFGGKTLWNRGYLGVDFFLMLSGFLMARIQEPRFAAGIEAWPWLGRRYLRLWPMMAAGTALGVLSGWTRCAGLADWIQTGVMSLALVPTLTHQFLFPFNVPAWTILLELLCNAAHLFIFRHLRGGGLIVTLLGLGALMLWVAIDHASLNVGATPGTLLPALPRAGFAYALGILMARAWTDRPSWPVPAFLALPLMPVLLVGFWWLGFRAGDPHAWWFDPLFVVLACPVMIAGGLRMRIDGFGAGAARLAGQLSFPLFALQMPVLEGVHLLGGNYWLAVALALVAGAMGAVALAKGWRGLFAWTGIQKHTRGYS